MKEEKQYKKGDCIGHVGDTKINGGWAPHLHFQIIANMLGKKGDFPGVASLGTREKYLALCPNPNSILQFQIE